MTPTNERQEVLYFTEPYNYTPAVVVVGPTTGRQRPQHGSGRQEDGRLRRCTYEEFLKKELAIEGYEFDFIIDDAEVSGYDTDTTALQDLVNGRLDAVITSVTTAQGYIDAGNPVQDRGRPRLLRAAVRGLRQEPDPSSESLFEAVDEIVAEMHEDGTLTAMSEEWYGLDLTTQQ